VTARTAAAEVAEVIAAARIATKQDLSAWTRARAAALAEADAALEAA
jgi:hypothetical protein